jgi:hypothetical protein
MRGVDNMQAGSTLIQWTDYEGYFYLSTDSKKLVESLGAVGVKWVQQDEAAEEFFYKLPSAWLRLRLPKRGLLRLGWYPKNNKTVQPLMEDRPHLKVVKL